MPSPKTGPRAERATIRDVAAAAGVSTATVSYVLNDTPGQVITEVTRQRVQAAATSLGYAPHRLARALREGASRLVLLNVGAVTGGNSLDGFIRGLSLELDALGHALLVTTDRAQAGVPADVLDAVSPRAVLDLTGLASGHGVGTIYGTVDGHRGDLAHHAYVQVRHLVAAGHRRIGFAVPARSVDTVVDGRIGDFHHAAEALGVDATCVVAVEMDADRHVRASAVRAALDAHRVTAFACYDDDVAIAVLSTLSDLALRAPDDVAVIGFDEGAHGRHWRPALTTVRIDAEGFGRRAARVALGIDPGPWVNAPSELVVRESA